MQPHKVGGMRLKITSPPSYESHILIFLYFVNSCVPKKTTSKLRGPNEWPF